VKDNKSRKLPQASALVAAASDRDRAYFEEHPGVDRYVRRRMPGEFAPVHSDAELDALGYMHVEVKQVRPGFRHRKPFHLIDRLDYPSGRIPFEHVEMAADYAVSRGGAWRIIHESEIDFEGDGLARPTADRDLDDEDYFRAYPKRLWRVRRREVGEFGADTIRTRDGQPMAASSHVLVFHMGDDEYGALPLRLPPDISDEDAVVAAKEVVEAAKQGARPDYWDLPA
jgi:hypothetical protein